MASIVARYYDTRETDLARNWKAKSWATRPGSAYNRSIVDEIIDPQPTTKQWIELNSDGDKHLVTKYENHDDTTGQWTVTRTKLPKDLFRPKKGHVNMKLYRKWEEYIDESNEEQGIIYEVMTWQEAYPFLVD